MTTISRIEQLTSDIAENRVPGGSAFARAAAELIALRVERLPAGDTADEVRSTVTDVSRWVTVTKPSMAVVRNVADLAQTVSTDPHLRTGADVKSSVVAAMRGFMQRSEGAIAALAEHARPLIADGTTVLVHSYSASLEAILRDTVARGVRFTLLVTESRPYRESRRLIEAVVDSPTDVVLYSDAAVFVAAASADLALVGADTVFTDGSFANKTGSLPLAMACLRANVPLYVATELAKVYFGDVDDIEMELRPAGELSDQWPPIESGRVRVWNQFFERVEAEHVRRYVTESGLISPYEVSEAASRTWQSDPLRPTAAHTPG
ncbi:eIF2B alpha/beta/delta subunit family protein [Jatrophihabitans fulvus]